METNAGARLRHALQVEQPLQIVGTINAYAALLAERAGFQALYLSGAGVANYSYGVTDTGITTVDNVAEDIRRITGVTPLPLLVDADTGFEDIAQTVQVFTEAGAAGLHLEDQVEAKRCGHLPGKQLVDTDTMCERVRQAVAAKTEPDFVIMARTDAIANEGIDAALARAQAYVDAGADMIFAEAVTELNDYQRFVDGVAVPVLANITEFGKTPLWGKDELASVGVSMVLYPLSATRAMQKAAETVYEMIREQGSQAACVDSMQTRAALYEVLGYEVKE